jgi:hypothetical protein
MKKFLTLGIAISLSTLILPSSFADDAGGYAVVDPSTGKVHGVIVADNADPFNNGGTMPRDYMGCPAGCKIVQQSTSDNTGNVVGIHGDNVQYRENTRTFIINNGSTSNTDVVSTQTSGDLITETQIVTTTSESLYEFGIQDLKKTNGVFEMKQVSPSNNSTVNLSAFNKVFKCENNNIYSCSGLSSDLLGSIDFAERKTEEQVRSEIVVKQIQSMINNISIILDRLKYWIK